MLCGAMDSPSQYSGCCHCKASCDHSKETGNPFTGASCVGHTYNDSPPPPCDDLDKGEKSAKGTTCADYTAIPSECGKYDGLSE